jgi:hypothetical protein
MQFRFAVYFMELELFWKKYTMRNADKIRKAKLYCEYFVEIIFSDVDGRLKIQGSFCEGE